MFLYFILRDGCFSSDASQQRECCIKCPLDVIVEDYNALSLCCNHLDASAEKYCPRVQTHSAAYKSVDFSTCYDHFHLIQ